jgi:hypothetical protein
LKQKVAALATAAALGVIATVLVYERRVQVSRADAPMQPGDAASMGPSGIERGADSAAAEVSALLVAPTPAPARDLAQREDAALRRDISDLARRLRVIEAEKAALALRLGHAEGELARRGERQTERRERDEFDLDRDDWKKLAKTGSIKYRVPCQEGWTPAQLDQLGLASDDAEPLRAAYERSSQRVWSVLRPLCVEAIGNDAVVDILGPDTCTQVVLQMSKTADDDSMHAAMREVGETRAGERPPPAPGVPRHPVFELFWTLTGETAALEADLAESFGPEDAKRIVYSATTCSKTRSYANGQ